MTNLHVDSTSSNQTPAGGVKERLAQLLETAQQLLDNADWIQGETADLFSDLKDVAQGAPFPYMGTAIDAAAWVDSAASNITDELSVLIGCLQEAVAV